MAEQITAQEYYQDYASWPLIDVRSPGEYNKGHIIGAHNIPLFSDAERADVGTIYKQISREKAEERGRSYVAPKLQRFIDMSKEIAKEDRVVVHCWRGGMRSQAFANHLLDNRISQVVTIAGGYKGYRAHMRSTLEHDYNFVVLSGHTGTGKTAILHELGQLGEQYIDLEGRANHKGSSFGGIGEKEQPSTEHFHNLIYEDLRRIDRSRRVWIEDEGVMVGKVNLPLPLYEQIRKAKTLVVDLNRHDRAKRLVDDYAHQGDDLLKEAILRLQKRLGGQHVNAALDLLRDGAYEEVAEICLAYYDKYYQKSLDKREKSSVHTLTAMTADARNNAEMVQQWADKEKI